jgi:superfamily II DNA or RNA helicase
MAFRVYAIPSYQGDAVDLVALDPMNTAPSTPGIVHYSYAVAARDGVVDRRAVVWTTLRDFASGYSAKQPATIERLTSEAAYRPGEGVLDSGTPDFGSQLNTVIRLGALELLANLHAGRLTATNKDPFPHQLALQQFMRTPRAARAPQRLLIADEVGLGKTIEVGLVLRDILIAHGSLDNYACLYLTSGGLVDDAASKLREVMQGVLDNRNIVETVTSFRSYGDGNISGVQVASMHAARRYVTPAQKQLLHQGTPVAPSILIVDECHHAASDQDLSGVSELGATPTTQTYKAVWQMVNGEYWPRSRPPDLVIFMSATPFRSREQFVNLLRVLAHGVPTDTLDSLDAFAPSVDATGLTNVVRSPATPVHVIWRRQDDPEVHSWSGRRLFPRLEVIRPHRDLDRVAVPLGTPDDAFLGLVERVKASLSAVSKAHGVAFHGFASFQLEKKLTSSSVAGACWLFTWAVRHNAWPTKQAFGDDRRAGTQALRQLLLAISRRLAQYSTAANAPQFAAVEFPSDGFIFPAINLAQTQRVDLIYDYHKALREDQGESGFVLAEQETDRLCALALEVLAAGAAQDLKLQWLRGMLTAHPDARFLVFTDNLQTCAVMRKAFGTVARELVGSMDPAARRQAVADLRLGRGNARLLVATSAADEGFDLQVADHVVHWDISASPAVLMQRNGRVARLGQRADVKAYYLILEGTHEERRDTRLQETFGALGIDDEALRHKILGSLSDDEVERLDQAVENADGKVIGSILRAAAADNQRMEADLRELTHRLEAVAVLDRDALCDRLSAWQQLGLPETPIDYTIKEVQWQRPVFGEVATVEPATSRRAELRRGKQRHQVVFDPEFIVFADDTKDYSLAGLRPWTRHTTTFGLTKIRPDAVVDCLGDLLCQLVRLPKADLSRLDAEGLAEKMPELATARWLLFCTHPIREDETEHRDAGRPYLTYYAFCVSDEGSVACVNPEGASAGDVRSVIQEMERQALLSAASAPMSAPIREQCSTAGAILRDWVGSVTKFGQASFLAESRFFLPIPVALVSVEPRLL